MFYVVAPVEEWKNYVSNEYYEIIMALNKQYGWKLLQPFEQVPDDAKIVLQWETYQSPWNDNGRNQRWFFCDDLHYSNPSKFQLKQKKFTESDQILGTYVYRLEDAGYTFDADTTWIPHSASSRFMKDFNPTPDKHVLVPQPDPKTSLWYPLRSLASNHRGNVKVHPHPGYTHYPSIMSCSMSNYKIDPSLLATEMNNSLATFCDLSIFNYLSAKHFEIPATGSMLLCDSRATDLLEPLGFIEGQHYMTYNEFNFPNVIESICGFHIDDIRKRAYELIRQKHTVHHRAEEINKLALTTDV